MNLASFLRQFYLILLANLMATATSASLEDY
jgi:hypothetical protein